MNDWKSAFGVAPASFEKSVRIALNHVKEKEGMKHRMRLRPGFRAALVAACALLLATSAFAAAIHFGLVDFFDRQGKQMPKGAEYLIETAVPQQTPAPRQTADEELVRFAVREAVCGTEQFYVVVEARPVDPTKYLLLSLDAGPNDPVSDAGVEGETGTFKELAQREGKKLLNVNAAIELDGEYVSDTADYVLEKDGTVVLMLSGKGPGTVGEKTFTCKTAVALYDENDTYSMEDIVRSSFTFSLNVAAAADATVYSQEQPGVVEGTGVVIEQVQLKRSELETYAELTFAIDPSATEEEKKRAADGLWFEYIDANGDRLPGGLSGSGRIEDLGGGRFLQKQTLSAMDPLPESIIVRAFDCWDKTRFGTVKLKHK